MHKTLSGIRCFVMAVAALAFVLGPPRLYAQTIPAQYEVPIAINSAPTTWAVPGLQNGQLLALEALGITNGATLAVSHLVLYGSASYITNVVESAAAVNTWYAYPAAYTPPFTQYYTTNNVILSATSSPPKPVWLVPGDKLLFTLSVTNTPATVVLRTGVR